MKTNLLDISKRKFLWMGAAALASMKLIKFPGTAQAMGKTGEASSKSLEDRIASLEHEVMRLQAINEIENLMGRYEAIHIGEYIHKTWELFARHTPNTWMDVANWGIFEGIDSIKRVWTTPMPAQLQMGNAPPVSAGQIGASTQPQKGKGGLTKHPLTTPVIQVAKDGKTAKALWWSPGMERGGWAYGEYANDFVKEDGVWRIWHLKWFRVFITPFDQSWDESQDPAAEGDWRKADKPVKYHKPYNSPYWTAEPIPPAPKPYDTWTERDEGWQYTADENWGEGTMLSVPET